MLHTRVNRKTSEGKSIPAIKLTPQHGDIGENGIVTSYIRVVRFKSRQFCPEETGSRKGRGRAGRVWSVFGSCGKERTLFPMAGIEHRYLGCPARTVATVLIDLPPTNLDTNIYSTLYPTLNDKSNWLTA